MPPLLSADFVLVQPRLPQAHRRVFRAPLFPRQTSRWPRKAIPGSTQAHRCPRKKRPLPPRTHRRILPEFSMSRAGSSLPSERQTLSTAGSSLPTISTSRLSKDSSLPPDRPTLPNVGPSLSFASLPLSTLGLPQLLYNQLLKCGVVEAGMSWARYKFQVHNCSFRKCSKLQGITKPQCVPPRGPPKLGCTAL
ncbi:hypothetical protein HPB48_015222 [Haemaphysalis longicornis]|uniref:Uncharacterized protein n=1 Tax=Haemaphysalis longicornis TaxID=44386 RepID=A0A9J6FJ14_HAELO|nr:hypothetical protein HPB48_015222 [Haemaphysalis longicornis]